MQSKTLGEKIKLSILIIMLHPRRVIHVELQTRLMTLSQTVAVSPPPPVGDRRWGSGSGSGSSS